MNPLKGIARQLTQKTLRITGMNDPEVYSISEWKIVEVSIIYQQSTELSKPLISDDLCFRISHISTSKNLLLDAPKV